MEEKESLKALNDKPFFLRFYHYQKERFPFLAHGLLITAFTFSAVSYSIISRGQDGFIDLTTFLIGIFTTVTLFFLVRIFDEFKDREDDARYRSYLPVPRGLITLSELRITGIVTVILQVAVILIWQPEMIGLYGMVMIYLLLMGVEFFVSDWLKPRQLLYITSHMFIIPLIDLYASGLDWWRLDLVPHTGLLFFFAVSYFNGLVLEFGRKIRAPEDEEEGVVSYTGLYGLHRGVWFWIGLLAITLAWAIAATTYAGYGWIGAIVLSGFFILCSWPGIQFLLKPSKRWSKMIEYASAFWTIAMYLSLGGIPMLARLMDF